ncbi:MAG: glutamate--tRNA ligase, partial [Chloroflexi bacterium]|nr:glutamate--tRNA ligase [Chloroflexota bacterium]
APAALNFTKLDHFNGVYIRSLDVADLAARMKPFFEEAGYDVSDSEKLMQVAAVLQVRLGNLTEASEKGGFFFVEDVEPEAESLIGKKMDTASALALALRIEKLVADLPDFSIDSANQPFRDLAAEMDTKVGNVFGFLRDSITAQKVSPPIFETMEIVGREKVLERIRHGVELLETLQ